MNSSRLSNTNQHTVNVESRSSIDSQVGTDRARGIKAVRFNPTAASSVEEHANTVAQPSEQCGPIASKHSFKHRVGSSSDQAVTSFCDSNVYEQLRAMSDAASAHSSIVQDPEQKQDVAQSHDCGHEEGASGASPTRKSKRDPVTAEEADVHSLRTKTRKGKGSRRAMSTRKGKSSKSLAQSTEEPADNQDWCYSRAEFQKLHKAYGPFTLDAAADVKGHNAQVKRYCSKQDSFLSKPLQGETVWCNFPFDHR